MTSKPVAETKPKDEPMAANPPDGAYLDYALPTAPHGPVDIAIHAADVSAWEARLTALGLPIESRVTWERGGLSLYFRDPDGRSVELATPGLWPSY